MKRLVSILLLTGAFVMAGCGDSENFVFTNTNPVQQLPVAVNDAYNTNEDTQLTVNAANGVLANDTPNGSTITAFDSTSTQNGTVALLADGGFTYTPASGFTGPDTFTYTLMNGSGSDTATVTITVVAVNGFFVDATNGNDATGSFQGGNPFQTIQAAVTAAGTNQDIIVRPGTYNENVTLLDGQRLLGSGSVLAQGTEPEPVINGGGITLADGNTVDYFLIQNSPGDAITGNGTNGATITNNEISGTTSFGNGIGDARATGTWTITDNTITDTDSIGIFLRGETGDNLVALIQDNIITGNAGGANAFSYGGTSTVRAQVLDNQMTGTVNPGATFEVIAGDTADMCLEIRGNINDDRYRFAAVDATAMIEVVQLAQLETINSGGADVSNGAGSNFPASGVTECTTP